MAVQKVNFLFFCQEGKWCKGQRKVQFSKAKQSSIMKYAKLFTFRLMPRLNSSKLPLKILIKVFCLHLEFCTSKKVSEKYEKK